MPSGVAIRPASAPQAFETRSNPGRDGGWLGFFARDEDMHEVTQRGRRILTGYLAAIFLHTLFNSTALLAQIGVLAITIAEAALLFDFLLAIGLLIWLWHWAKEQPPEVTLPTDPQSAA